MRDFDQKGWKNPDCFDYIENKKPRPDNCNNAYYVFYEVKNLGFIAFFGTWILIFTNFVPISLMVTLELVKLG